MATDVDKMGEALESPDIRTSYISGLTFERKKVTYAAVDGLAVFEGDIVLGTVEEMEAIKQRVENPETPGLEGVVISGAGARWPGGVIVFRIDPNMPDQQRVTDAIRHWEANTNVRFRQRTNESNFVTFRSGSGCSSQVGMPGGEQFVTLGGGCGTGNAIHEIGHTAGLWHEQSREDRDSFVTIVLSNIQPNMRFNFDQHITDGDDVGSYDYGSIMHYPANAFAIDSSKPTIIAPQPIGQRNGLSTGDIATINDIYPRLATLGDMSDNGPALTTRGNQVLLGWTGTGNLRLNFLTSNDGLNFFNKVTLGDTSPVAPALAVFNNRYVVAWVGVGNNHLNIMQSTDGVNWSNKVTLGDTSQSSPALAAFGNQLFIAWVGVGNNQLNVMRSADGVNWGGKVTLGDTTTAGPALTVLGETLLLGWRGVSNNRLNVMQSGNGANWGNKVTLGETTDANVHLYTLGNRTFLSWRGVGNNRLNVLASTNGAQWGSKFTSLETSIDGPAVTSIGNSLVWGWTGTDPAHRLNTLLFAIV